MHLILFCVRIFSHKGVQAMDERMKQIQSVAQQFLDADVHDFKVQQELKTQRVS